MNVLHVQFLESKSMADGHHCHVATEQYVRKSEELTGEYIKLTALAAVT